jgi:AcrR family transcriptional regulator
MSRTSSPKPRSAGAVRRRKLPRLERERQMLDMAARVFGRRGFHAASMDEIARACGVTKPMLYAYFRSKEGLYLATVDRAGRYLVTSVQALLSEPDPMKRLRQGAELLLRFIARDRHGWVVLFSEGLGGGPVARRVGIYRSQITQAAAVTVTALGAARDAGDAATKQAEPYAVAMLGAGESLARWWLLNPDADLETVIALTQDMVSAIADAYCTTVLRRPTVPESGTRYAATPGP